MDMLFIVLGLICLLIAIVLFLIVACLWGNLRNFFHENYSFFEFLFIIIYFVEQLCLIVLFFKYPQYNPFWVSAFALVVLTTVSLQKLYMESKDKKITKESVEQQGRVDLIINNEKKLIDENKRLEKRVEELKSFIDELIRELKITPKLKKKR